MNVWDKLYIRDFLIACLMVIGGGHRSDVIRNMTLEEWNDRKIEEGEDEENQVQFNCWKQISLTVSTLACYAANPGSNPAQAMEFFSCKMEIILFCSDSYALELSLLALKAAISSDSCI